jgi:uncharacterized protein (DUF1778 family)
MLWVNKPDYKWIKETAKILLDKNIDKLSENQIGLLYELYLENLSNGLKPKEAMNKAFEIVNCFKT